MADEKDSAKGALIEKITFALLPLLFSCVVYLMSALPAAHVLRKDPSIIIETITYCFLQCYPLPTEV
jgi:hypothetical protein